MKKINKYIVIVICLLVCVIGVACGKSTNTDNGGNGGDIVRPDPKPEPPPASENVDCRYSDETSMLTWDNDTLTNVKITINGESYAASGLSFDVKALNLYDGSYHYVFTYTTQRGNTYDQQGRLDGNWGHLVSGDGAEVWVTFFNEKGADIKSVKLRDGYALTASDFPKTIAKVGVEYSWSKNVGDTISVSEQNRIELTANYIHYPIKFNLNGGGWAPNKEAQDYYTVEQPTYVLDIPIKSGYKFMGWYENSDLSGARVAKFDTSLVREITLYAKFAVKSNEEKTLLAAITATATAKEITIAGTANGAAIEQALSLTSGIYTHAVIGGKIEHINRDGKYYDYKTATCYDLSGEWLDPEFHSDPLALANLIDSFVSMSEPTASGNGWLTEATFISGDFTLNVEFRYENGKLTHFTSSAEGVDINITYSVTKKVPDAALVYVSTVAIFVAKATPDGNNTYKVADIKLPVGGDLNSNVELKNIIEKEAQGDYKFDGFYADADCKTAATATNYGANLYIKCVNLSAIVAETQYTIAFHCGCSECAGKVINVVSSYRHAFDTVKYPHFKLFAEGNDYWETENGKVISGYFFENSPKAQRIWLYDIFRKMEELANRSENFTNLVFDVYAVASPANTHCVKLHYGSIVDTVYVIHAQNIAQHVAPPEGMVVLESTPYSTSDFQKGTEVYTIYEDSEAYVKAVVGINLTLDYGKNIIVGHNGKYEPIYGAKRTVLLAPNSLISDYTTYETLQEDGKEVLVSGWYFDSIFTRPVGKAATITSPITVFAKWATPNYVTLQVKKELGVSEAETSKFNCAVGMNIYDALSNRRRPGDPDNIFDNWYNDNYMYISKFYKDEARTQEVTVYDGSYDTIYLGYVATPTLTLKCFAECTATVHTFKLIGGKVDYNTGKYHFMYMDGRRHDIIFYTDSACTIPYETVAGARYYTDTTLYGKTDINKNHLTIHCGCLKHKNEPLVIEAWGSEQDWRSLPDCDFGYTPEYPHQPNFFTDIECKNNYTFSDGDATLYVWHRTVEVYGVDAISAGGKVVLLASYMYFDKDVIKGQYGLYKDAECAVPRFVQSYNFAPIDNEKLYFKKIVGEQTLTIKAEGQQDIQLKYTKCDSAETYFNFPGFMIEGMYYDAACTDLIVKQTLGGFNVSGSATIYAKLIATPVVTIVCNLPEANSEYFVNGKREVVCDSYQKFDQIITGLLQFKDGGYGAALTRTEGGADYVDKTAVATAGTYYLCHRKLENHIKLTFKCFKQEPNAEEATRKIMFGDEQIGIGDHAYAPKGDYTYYVDKLTNNHCWFLINGQRIMRNAREIQQNMFSDEACTQRITSFISDTDVNLYTTLDESTLKGCTLHFKGQPDSTAVKFYYDSDEANNLLSYAGILKEQRALQEFNCSSTFFNNFMAKNSIVAFYIDKDYKVPYGTSRPYNPEDSDLYCVIGDTITVNIVGLSFPLERTYATAVTYGAMLDPLIPSGADCPYTYIITYTQDGVDFVNMADAITAGAIYCKLVMKP